MIRLRSQVGLGLAFLASVVCLGCGSAEDAEVVGDFGSTTLDSRQNQRVREALIDIKRGCSDYTEYGRGDAKESADTLEAIYRRAPDGRYRERGRERMITEAIGTATRRLSEPTCYPDLAQQLRKLVGPEAGR